VPAGRISAERLRSAYLAVCAARASSLLAPSTDLWFLSLFSCRTCSFEGVSSYDRSKKRVPAPSVIL